MDDQTFLNQLAEKLSKLGTVRPLGFHYLHPYETVPADSIICNGATYSRALYKDFFDYIKSQNWVKTEAEWQEIAKRDNGYCPFYSDGDGSTNFRTPKFAPYQQIAMEVAQATTYHQAGIPDLQGDIACWFALDRAETFTGVFKNSVKESTQWRGFSQASGNVTTTLNFKASDSNVIYGRSTTVTPESHEWVMCVVAYGVATNVGSVDIQNVMSAVNAVQAKVAKLDGVKSVVVETWKDSNGANWYRKWSDGFIEQGGWFTSTSNKHVTFHVAFTRKPVVFSMGSIDTLANPTYRDHGYGESTTGFNTYGGGTNGGYAWKWYACGY